MFYLWPKNANESGNYEESSRPAECRRNEKCPQINFASPGRNGKDFVRDWGKPRNGNGGKGVGVVLFFYIIKLFHKPKGCEDWYSNKIKQPEADKISKTTAQYGPCGTNGGIFKGFSYN